MKNLKTILGVLLTTALLFAGCSKNDDDDMLISKKLDYDTILGFFEANGVQAQTFTIDAESGGSITGSDGTVVTFPANAFTSGDETPITGTVNIAMKELFRPSQMILSNKPTNALNLVGEHTFLLSEGETEVVVSQNGNELQLLPGIAYQVTVPSAGGFEADMLPFQGTPSDTEGILWEASGRSAGTNGQENMEYIAAPASYIYDVFDTGWSNCDMFAIYPGPKTTNYVDLTTSPNATETVVYIVYKENNLPAVVKFSTTYANGLQSYVDSLPVGLDVTYVAITLENNQQYLAIQNVTISEEEEITLNFEAKTTQEILVALAMLD